MGLEEVGLGDMDWIDLDGFCDCRSELFGFHKMRGIS
jgi:hypothetical protein